VEGTIAASMVQKNQGVTIKIATVEQVN
jgi:hypothetical protein